MTTEEFNRHIKDGNFQNIFIHVYKRCFKSVAGLIRNKNGNTADAEDVFQDAVMVLFGKVKKGDFELTTSVCAYLSKTSKYVWFNKIRNEKRSKYDTTDTPPESANDDDLMKLLVEKEAHEMMKKSLLQLTDLCREALRAYYFEGKSTKELAEIAGVSTNTVKQRLFGCRSSLRNYIQTNHAEYIQK